MPSMRNSPSESSGDFWTLCPEVPLSVIPSLLALCRGGPGRIFTGGLRPKPIREQMANAAKEAARENAARPAPAKGKEARDDR